MRSIILLPLFSIISLFVVGQEEGTLSKLQDGDTLSIQFRSQGCWNRSESRLVITREGQHLVARMIPGSSFNVFTRGRAKPPADSLAVKAVVLNDEQLRVYARFEQELRAVSDGGCTLKGYYEISSKYLQLKRTDGSCQWGGFNYLKQSFFGAQQVVQARIAE